MTNGKFHIGPSGPAPCRTDLSNPNSRGCPFGGKSGEEKHFNTLEEAESYYAETMEEAHGLFPKATAKAGENLSPVLERRYTNVAAEIMGDGTYGISKNPGYGFIADDSEGLRRFAHELEEKGDGHLSVETYYVDDTDDEVIQSVCIPEIGLKVANQNVEVDLREFEEYKNNTHYGKAYYWKSTM